MRWLLGLTVVLAGALSTTLTVTPLPVSAGDTDPERAFFPLGTPTQKGHWSGKQVPTRFVPVNEITAGKYRVLVFALQQRDGEWSEHEHTVFVGVLGSREPQKVDITRHIQTASGVGMFYDSLSCVEALPVDTGYIVHLNFLAGLSGSGGATDGADVFAFLRVDGALRELVGFAKTSVSYRLGIDESVFRNRKLNAEIGAQPRFFLQRRPDLKGDPVTQLAFSDDTLVASLVPSIPSAARPLCSAYRVQRTPVANMGGL